jgi:hypothetical protein
MNKLPNGQLAAISRFFSSTVVREMARTGRSPLFARLARQSSLLDSLASSEPASSLFEKAFSLLKREGYRHEYIYKTALMHKILLGKHSLQTASMLTEFRVCECKADLVILNGTATVYEVKSERDSLSRLERQIGAYSKVFGQVYVIAAEDHTQTVLNSLPKAVGILKLTSRYRISTLREAVDLTDSVSPAAIFESVRTEEARRILLLHGVSIPDVPNTLLNAELRRLFVQLKPRDAHQGMVRVLKKTRDLLPLSDLVAQLPKSLQTAALSIPLRKIDHARLVAAVNTKLQDMMAWA